MSYDRAKTPKVKIKGGPDRDARDVPYSVGNRAQRRKTNAEVNKVAAGIKKVKKNGR